MTSRFLPARPTASHPSVTAAMSGFVVAVLVLLIAHLVLA